MLSGKNLVGAFYNPKGVIIDTSVLGTLPKKEFQAGLAEVIKYALIQNKSLFVFLEKHAQEILLMDYQIIGPQQLSEMDQNKQKRSI